MLKFSVVEQPAIHSAHRQSLVLINIGRVAWAILLGELVTSCSTGLNSGPVIPWLPSGLGIMSLLLVLAAPATDDRDSRHLSVHLPAL